MWKLYVLVCLVCDDYMGTSVPIVCFVDAVTCVWYMTAGQKRYWTPCVWCTVFRVHRWHHTGCVNRWKTLWAILRSYIMFIINSFVKANSLFEQHIHLNVLHLLWWFDKILLDHHYPIPRNIWDIPFSPTLIPVDVLVGHCRPSCLYYYWMFVNLLGANAKELVV